MALQTEALDASMTWVLEKHRRAAETCLSLSCLAEAQQLVEMACLGLSSAREAQEKERLGRLGCSSKVEVNAVANSSAFGNLVCDAPSIAGSQRYTLPARRYSNHGAACEVANVSILQYAQAGTQAGACTPFSLGPWCCPHLYSQRTRETSISEQFLVSASFLVFGCTTAALYFAV